MRPQEGGRVDVSFRVIVEEVAHEVRTPLTTMRNRLLLARSRVDRARFDATEVDALREDIALALDGIDRIDTLVRELGALRDGGHEGRVAAVLSREEEFSGLVRRLVQATAAGR
ncbi:MAG TPA: hypothetical protein VI997_09305 [Candidatus Thermoplasmatota archaeon]|nr:hypothetical protein [Candidatus Thermoplasmatota archaeon]